MDILVQRDFSVQAATEDALNSTRLIADAARAAGLASPLLDLSSNLYDESVRLGNGRLDMVSVIEAIEARTEAVKPEGSEAVVHTEWLKSATSCPSGNH